tara:strand:+ start:946 stop:1536 length:591 start_codon:yes stop_codon:yes gene_type:complete
MIENILASSSPRRKELLNQIGFNFKIIGSNVTEHSNLNFPPEAFAEYWAREKSKAVAKSHPESIVIGADTIVSLNGAIYGKPKNETNSINMLMSLSGKTHEVVTGVSFICYSKDIDITVNERTYVKVAKLDKKAIINYIKKYAPYDKAGSYGIQDGFSVFIEKINGCYYNVMGLPLSSFYKTYNILFNERFNNRNN